MESGKKTAVFIVGFVLVGLMVAVLFPKEAVKNKDAVIRIGAGDDVSGILMQEIVDQFGEKYKVEETLESTSFQDC